MGKRNRSEFLLSNLPQLQNLIKRDKTSYKDEFLQQWRHYESALTIFKLKPDSESTEFGELVTFLSHVASCYPTECAAFPQHLVDLLSNHYAILNPDLRKTMVQALVLMRNKDLISPTSLLSLFFTLFRCKDKALRVLLHNHIVTDIKNANLKAKNNKLNKTLQNFMYTMLKDSSDIASKKSLDVMIDLYKKNIWNDAKTVNIISEAVFSDVPKIAATASQFFLNSNEAAEEESDDENVPDLTNLKHNMSINKKTKARKAQYEKALHTIKRKERNKNKAESFKFSALHLLNDPQGMAEKLFSRLRQVTANNSFRFEVRLLFMNLISRLIGVHRLMLLNFYDFMIPYLKPHQKEVTSIIAFVAQSSHELVPPDVLEVVVQAMADNFVWSNCASEVITAGLNGLREICVRCPLAMPETLLQSLIDDYKNHREKGPMNAARSLLGLYREVNPEMLKKKDRGKSASMNMKTFAAPQYGHVNVSSGVEGAEFLNEKAEETSQVGSDDEEAPLLVDGEEELEESGTEGEEELEEDDLEPVSGDEDEDSVAFEEIEGEEILSDDEEAENAGDSVPDDTEAKEPALKKVKQTQMIDKILTDEDFQKIKERRQQREAEKLAGLKPGQRPIADSDEEDADVVDPSKITAGIRRKNDYAARVEKIKAGREGREFGSKKGQNDRTSLTNKIKSKRNKAFMMIVHKRDVKGKAKRSLREKQQAIRAHVKKQKMKK